MTDKQEESYLLEIQNIPAGHIVCGYVAHLKVLDANGEVYWSQRSGGVNDMEAIGLAHTMVDAMTRDIRRGQKEVP